MTISCRTIRFWRSSHKYKSRRGERRDGTEEESGPERNALVIIHSSDVFYSYNCVCVTSLESPAHWRLVGHKCDFLTYLSFILQPSPRGFIPIHPEAALCHCRFFKQRSLQGMPILHLPDKPICDKLSTCEGQRGSFG